MIVDLGARAVSVVNDEPTAVFGPTATHDIRLTPTQPASHPRRAVVELRRFHGGLAPHVLLGARYEPGGDTLVVQVGEESPATLKRSCNVRLGKRKLVPGLPPELVEPVASGLARTLDVGPGAIVVDRAGFDPVETSPIIIELAAELLGRLLSGPGAPQLTDEELREWLEKLP